MHDVASSPLAAGYVPAPRPADEAVREAALRCSGIFRADLAVRLHDLVMQARHAMRTQQAALSIVTGDQQLLLARAGTEVDPSGRENSFCGHVVAGGHEVMVVPDTLLDARFAGNPFVTGEPRIRFYAGAPLVAPSGHALGTLCVFDPRPRRRLAEDELAVLRALAARVMAMAGRAQAH